LLKPLISLFCLFLLCFAAQAQEAKQYSFAHFSTAQGLASNFVHNITQDAKGFIWLGTVNGLQRYDGVRFMTFRHKQNDSSSIPSNNISCYMDRKQHLWIETEANRIGIFNTGKFTYKEVPIRWKGRLNINSEKSFTEDNHGHLFLVVQHHGVYVYNEPGAEFVPANGLMPAPAGWLPVSVTTEPKTDRIWIACDSGLALFNPASGHLSYRNHNIDKDPVIARFGAEPGCNGVTIDRNGEWFSFISWPHTSDNPFAFHYVYKTGAVQRFNLGSEMHLGYHEITGLLQQQNGRIWYYGKTFIAEYGDGKKHFIPVRNEYKDEQSIKFDAANNMFEDIDRNVWIATDNGVFLFNPGAQVFNSYNLIRPDGGGPVDAPVQTLVQLRNVKIWVGCWEYGLYCYDKNFNPLPLPPGFPKDCSQYNRSIWSIVQDSLSQKIWMGCQDGRIAIYDFDGKKTTVISPAIFEGNTIRQVVQDRQGNLWFGTHNGYLVKWDRTASSGNIREGYTMVLKTRRVRRLFIDSDSTLWAVTATDGLYKINPATNMIVRHFSYYAPEGYQLWNESPGDVLRYNDSIMLIANDALTILNTKTNKTSFFTEEDGLPSNTTVCLQKDSQGVVWIGMMNGLLRFNFEKRKMAIFDRRDGIFCDNFNPAEAFNLPGNRLAFGTDHNFLVFNPRDLVDTMTPPDVRITDFRSANRSLWMDSLARHGNKIKLPYDNTSVTIDFSDLVYLSSYRVMYMLEGLDKQWIRSDEKSREAIYNYLAPGNYVFKVKGENADGTSSKNITTLAITVKPPFWQTWWFYGFILLLIMAVLYWVDRERIKRLTALQKVRTQIAGNLHEDINSTLTNINLLSEMAKIKADKDIDRTKEYIAQIGAKSHNMIIAMDDILWSIHPGNDNMEKTLLRMTEFTDALKNRKGTNIEMAMDGKIKSLQLDMKSRHEFFLIFKDALRSMADHSNGTQILINIDLLGSRLSMKIHDNGSYDEPNSVFSDNCMLNMIKRADQIQAVLDIQTDKKGVSVILILPVL
jgi:ligand-binding sensor domain-containing protein/signal transduction histidine kinase